MSNSSSDSDASYEHVDAGGSVLSFNSWDDVSNATSSGGEQLGTLAEQLGSSLRIQDVDDDLSHGLSEAFEAIDMMEPGDLPVQQNENALCTTETETETALTSDHPAARSYSRMDNLRDSQFSFDSLDLNYCSEPPQHDRSGLEFLPAFQETAAPPNTPRQAMETRPHHATPPVCAPPSTPAYTTPPCTNTWATGVLAETFAAPEDLFFRGTFEQAMAVAKDSKKLLLVSIQDYDGNNAFASFAVNRDIFRNEQFRNLVPDRYIFVQLLANNAEAIAFAKHFQVEHFPHLGIIYPGQRKLVWGTDGWSSEKPWTPGKINEALVDWGFARFTQEHHELMEVDEDEAEGVAEEEFIIDPITDINQEYLLQEAAMADIDLDDPAQVENFFHLQAAMLWH